jgi:hypothetical protein
MAMTTDKAIAIARSLKAGTRHSLADVQAALISLLDHGEKVEVPDFETAVRMVAANLHAQGRHYIEIAVNPATKEVGWRFEPDDGPSRN